MLSQQLNKPDEETAKLGMIAYTDGSCKPTSYGFTGWGFHAYTYEIGDTEKPVIIGEYQITDYGYIHKKELHFKYGNSLPKPVEPIEYFENLGSSLEQGTNNRAEIKAMIETMILAKQKNVGRLVIRADSQYAKNGLISWCANWARNNWVTSTNEPVANRDLWEIAYPLYKDLKDSGVNIFVHWVKGHDDRLGNVQADVLAGLASNYSLEGKFVEFRDVFPAKNYWKSEVERHPFFAFKRIYFNSNEKYNQAGTYYHADTGAADHLLGKRIPETGLSVIRLKEPEPLFEMVRSKQYQTSKEFNSFIMMKLDRIYDKNIYPYLVTHGGSALTPSKKNMNLNWFDRRPINVDVNTAGLSMRAVEAFNLLEELLDTYVKTKENKDANANTSNLVNLHDVTSTFFDYNETKVKQETVLKCTLKAEYVVGYQDMSISIEETHDGSSKKLKIPLILGTDLLPRNNLKKIEVHNPKVYLITWREGQQSLRYATIIDTDIGIGIWSNFFADRIFFK